MKNLEYIRANDFDRAWLNFELDLPLKPDKNDQPNPFYIDRPGNPIAELVDGLMAPFYRPPKFFFSGTPWMRQVNRIAAFVKQCKNPEEVLADQLQYSRRSRYY